MNTELLGVGATMAIVVVLAPIVGRYMARVYEGERTILDVLLRPLEGLFLRIGGVKREQAMSWKQNLLALLSINLVWFLLSMAVLMNMQWLPLNPDNNPSMSADLAFNTAISFVSNTNLQHYSGESGVSYLGQLTLMLFQFVSAGCGMAIAVIVIMSMRERASRFVANFFVVFVQSCVRILLPMSIVLALILLLQGVPMSFAGKEQMVTMQGDSVMVSRGPVAAFVAIKQIGTNGGGFFGANSAHPLENPSYLSNMCEAAAIVLIPIAMIFMLGRLLARKRLAWMILGVMSLCFIALFVPTYLAETQGNPLVDKLGVLQNHGSMEGKETRIGACASALWAVLTTCTSNGSVNAMHDSLMPLSGMNALLGMMVNCVYGGVGVGFLNFYVFIILAVFISGLMVGRTPEFLGKKIEAREMKIAMIVALLHPLLILAGTAIASFCSTSNPQACAGWLNNPSFHGFSEMLYEFTSSSANNGSGFEGLGDNTMFWNVTCGIVMLLARFIPIIGPVAIAGLLAEKKAIPEGPGTLQTDTATFASVVLAVIVIVAALSFFPALALGPIAEHLSMH